MSDIPEISDERFKGAISAKLRTRLMRGGVSSGADIVALRRFVGLSQAEFARAMEISVHTLRNWEQGRRIQVDFRVGVYDEAIAHPDTIRSRTSSQGEPAFGFALCAANRLRSSFRVASVSSISSGHAAMLSHTSATSWIRSEIGRSRTSAAVIFISKN